MNTHKLSRDVRGAHMGKLGTSDDLRMHLLSQVASSDHVDPASALFLGPRAENHELLRRFLDMIVSSQHEWRQAYFPGDRPLITENLQERSADVAKAQEIIEARLERFLKSLSKWSIPFHSPRYNAHISYEACLPGILGYFAAMLNNPNNVAFEGGPYTTQLELLVGLQMCEILGYNIDTDNVASPSAWGHITCDGTVANIESIWVSRNLKFYPLSLREAMLRGHELDFISDTFKIETCQGATKLLSKCSVWEILNLKVSTILEIPDRLYREYNVSVGFLESALKRHLIQTTGKDVLMRKWGMSNQPIIVIPNTRHYSWPRGAALTGIGSENLINIDMDVDGRMDTNKLRDYLMKCAERQIAVYQVVAVMGSTAEGAVDRLRDIINIRNELNNYGLSFVVHADAAAGGYFATMLPQSHRHIEDVPFLPHVSLRPHTATHLYALRDTDSVTIDPHKAGYAPYPAGGLCYKDGRMRFLLTWTAPYIDQGDTAKNVSIFGIEGSKAGAAAAAVYFTHDVIGTGPDGFGTLLGEALFTCRKFAAHWATISDDATPFMVVPLNRLPSERRNLSTEENVNEEKRIIRERILDVENDELLKDPDAMALLNELGPDLNINVFACNFRHADGTLNKNVREANRLNRRVYERLSVSSPGQDPMRVPFYLSCSTLKESDYGTCVRTLKERLGLSSVGDDDRDLFVLRNVVMSPLPVSRGFMCELVETFRSVLLDEVENMRQCMNGKAPSIQTSGRSNGRMIHQNGQGGVESST